MMAAARSESEPAATMVGSETCKDCHQKEYQQYLTTSHGRGESDGASLPEKMQCETCHGPGSAHAAAAGDSKDPGFATIWKLDKMAPAKANEICQGCHKAGDQFYWRHSAHARKDIACVTCHSLHSPKDAGGARLLKAETTTKLCVTCHKANHFALGKSAHMPVAEGDMTCNDCHNPHGSAGPKQIRALSTNELCTTCHADKRGPFLWEHAPVRENCLTCHEPHGSNNDKVLAAKRPYLCQRCHIGTRHPSTLYDLPDLTASTNNRSLNRSCTNCHAQIHGSNHPSGKYFTR
jgi:DmsE family decaheme c-type cytochrome